MSAQRGMYLIQVQRMGNAVSSKVCNNAHEVLPMVLGTALAIKGLHDAMAFLKSKAEKEVDSTEKF
jgi:CRISPR/Cas system CMR-associated protein Cmr5 small subunit